MLTLYHRSERIEEVTPRKQKNKRKRPPSHSEIAEKASKKKPPAKIKTVKEPKIKAVKEPKIKAIKEPKIKPVIAPKIKAVTKPQTKNTVEANKKAKKRKIDKISKDPMDLTKPNYPEIQADGSYPPDDYDNLNLEQMRELVRVRKAPIKAAKGKTLPGPGPPPDAARTRAWLRLDDENHAAKMEKAGDESKKSPDSAKGKKGKKNEKDKS